MIIFLKIGFGIIYIIYSLFAIGFFLIFWKQWPLNSFFLIFSLAFLPVFYELFWGKEKDYIDPQIRARMKDFADSHNFQFFEKIFKKTPRARFLSLSANNGLNKKDVIEFYYRGFKVNIFEHFYFTGDKQRTIKRITMAEILFTKTSFPHILFVRPAIRFSENIFRYKSDVEIKPSHSLKDFRLYVTRGYQTEALQIFTLDFLHYLNYQSPVFGLEFVKDKLYIFEFKEIYSREYLDDLLEIIEKVIDFVGEKADRLHDDFDSLHTFFRDRK